MKFGINGIVPPRDYRQPKDAFDSQAVPRFPANPSERTSALARPLLEMGYLAFPFASRRYISGGRFRAHLAVDGATPDPVKLAA